MLPAPAVSRSRSQWGSSSPQTTTSWAELGLSGSNRLSQRSRATNLAVLLLAALAGISLLLNVRLYFGDAVFRPPRPGDRSVPSFMAGTIPRYSSSLHHLIMVPGHAVWVGNDLERTTANDQWVLQENQKHGATKTFIKHITKGVELVAKDPDALLVFSGSMTRKGTQRTEAQSYLEFAEAMDLFLQWSPSTPMPFPRATTELYALDSYQNLLFSIARFKEVTGHYPSKITVVGFGMKRRRFEDIHRVAIRWPAEQFHYIGIDDEEENGASYAGEFQNGLHPYQSDIYGCHGRLLAKRRTRNLYNRYAPYMSSAPEMAALIDYCPSEGTKLFRGSLPWS